MPFDANGKLTPLDPNVLSIRLLNREVRKIQEDNDRQQAIMRGELKPADGIDDPTAKFLVNFIHTFASNMLPDGMFKQSIDEQTNVAIGLLRHLITEMEMTTPETRGNATFGGILVFINALTKSVDTLEGFAQLHNMVVMAGKSLDASMQAWLNKEILAGRNPLKDRK